jgi:predicted nucleic acid-binding protein
MKLMPGRFIDTNILLYITSSDPVKAAKAEEIVGLGGIISVQVLNEFTNVARRKMNMSWTETHDFLNMLRSLLTVHPLTIETHETGLALAERYGFSTYDAMIVGAAAYAGCDTLWSEDMHDGLVVENRLRIVNPFRTAA